MVEQRKEIDEFKAGRLILMASVGLKDGVQQASSSI